MAFLSSQCHLLKKVLSPGGFHFRSFATGSVKWYDRKKGFGFILGADEKDYFVHYTSINMDGFRFLEENLEVSFDTKEEADGKMKAVNVSLPDGSPIPGYSPR
ncbi:unnamed protein product [Heterosigma akashiwo]|mmetsp:Transcript_6346/g.8813  ORF Transcript_6346/g.8813 Transcript_6346/m.8813 type:complete len:103 (+) Transcript_6346:70-378(+)|eukprot:CAMPEP_0194582160 /NCGR_PEP_ID=MMETSP0292-20121207/15394_1 /TAXON_ID=39354 /ORGANISM="Heterosigma akashiwo, Strain CCMP2393" /LENGTH=102 /DNA_ID=CAMNT_0039436169 /DNA_START=92 /DNA_END=400 /DNA_ORIENTATION=+